MPKMVLIVTLVVILGSLFGATSYLLKTPTTDLSIINPVVETQCKIDFDCELVYIGLGRCPSLDSSIDDHECFNKDEAIKIRRSKGTNACSFIGRFDEYICKCANGKCEKVKIEGVEEVVITTDKMEYEQGEMVSITVKNNLNKPILFREFGNPCFSSFSIGIKREDYRMFYDLGTARCLTDMGELKPNAEIVFLLKVDDIDRILALINISIVYPGTYKLELNYGFSSDNLKEEIIYSNEFTIKEKSTLNARCGEKVVGMGQIIPDGTVTSCPRIWSGYEFDLNLKKCVEKKVSGCSVKSPFGSLEECQEVCEKADLFCPVVCSKILSSVNIKEISSLELEGGMYYGNLDEKKKGTPDDWIHVLEGTKSSSWRLPENGKNYDCDCN